MWSQGSAGRGSGWSCPTDGHSAGGLSAAGTGVHHCSPSLQGHGDSHIAQTHSRFYCLEASRTARHGSRGQVLLLRPPLTLPRGRSQTRHREVTLASKASSTQLSKELLQTCR